MSDRLALRRHLYEQLHTRRRGRAALRRQIALLDSTPRGPRGGPDDGGAGVREPRRPLPSAGPAAAARSTRPA
jgi:hypothetical protein